MGGSIGLAVRAAAMPLRIVGYGHRAATLHKAREYGAIDEGYEDLSRAVRDADLVILCTPVGLFGDTLRRIGPELKPGAVVTDVGSTKRSVVRQAEEVLPPGVRFVGSHPMAGSEKRGIEFARADLFQNALCITTPTPRTDAEALKNVEAFWTTIGMRTCRLSPEEHDRLLADVSHLPHAVAAALVGLQEEAALPLAGKGFLDATRIAGGDGGLWRDILLDNRDNVRAAVQRLKNRLDSLATMLERGEEEAVKQWLDAAAARREELVRQKLRELGGE